jgi:integrase
MDELSIFRLFLQTDKGQRDKTLYTNIKIIKKIIKTTPLRKDSVEQFIRSLMVRQLAPSYIKQHIGVIKQWGECFHIPELEHYPYPKIKYKTIPFVKATLSDEEIDDFLKLPFVGKGAFYKDRYDMWTVFFSVQAWTGMRSGEVAKLMAEDVDFGRNVIILAETKTNTPRLVPIPPDIKILLREHIAQITTEYLFPTYQKSKLPYVTESAWEYAFNERIKRLGIKRKNLTAYSLRHSFITRQLDEDVNLKKVQEIVGHKRIETTAGYTHLSMKSLQKVIDNDRLRTLYQTGKEAMQTLYKEVRKLEEKYNGLVFTSITPSENDEELVIVFKIRK